MTDPIIGFGQDENFPQVAAGDPVRLSDLEALALVDELVPGWRDADDPIAAMNAGLADAIDELLDLYNDLKGLSDA